MTIKGRFRVTGWNFVALRGRSGGQYVTIYYNQRPLGGHWVTVCDSESWLVMSMNYNLWQLQAPWESIGDSLWQTEINCTNIDDNEWRLRSIGGSMKDNLWQLQASWESLGDSFWQIEVNWINIDDNDWRFEVNWWVNEWQFVTINGFFGLAANNWKLKVNWGSMVDNLWLLQVSGKQTKWDLVLIKIHFGGRGLWET